MKITFLGTGTSHGVPKIGCFCPVCTSIDPKNKRTRSSIFVIHDKISFVIDTGPEFRLQALRERITRLDAVFYTHDHADHMNGIDDLRVFCEKQTLDVFGPEQVLQDISARFPYAVGRNAWKGGVPQLTLHHIPQQGVSLGSLIVQPIPLIHGCRDVFGYRIGSFAYITDCKTIPHESVRLLYGVDTLVIDALRYTPHPTHMSVDEAVVAAREIGASQTFLTHINHRMDHDTLEAYLPEHVHVAYDGLSIEVAY